MSEDPVMSNPFGEADFDPNEEVEKWFLAYQLEKLKLSFVDRMSKQFYTIVALLVTILLVVFFKK